MCLLVVAFGVDSNYPLIVAGNRDEFHARPSADAGWWPDDPDILGGRDLQAGGTWLALHRRGRFSAVTNYHDAQPRNTELRSRGHLVTDFLHSTLEPLSYLGTIDGALYAGFNLFVSDGRSLAYCSNRGVAPTQLSAGIYGLSNATLDTPWSKVERSKQRLRGLIETTAVSATGLLELQRRLSSCPITGRVARPWCAPTVAATGSCSNGGLPRAANPPASRVI
jgi:uncharacterized protein with NRDE domain